MQIADVEAVRTVRHEIARHAVDARFVTISAHSGIVHLNGEIKPLTGHEAQFADEIHTLYRCLKNRPGIHDVVFEWKLPPGYESSAIQRATH